MANEIRFEWDPRKSEANRRKHGIDFEFAKLVFLDSFRRLEVQGDEHGEIRWTTTGTIGGNVYVVSHTLREKGEIEIYRIISARKAAPRERHAFEETF